VSHYRNITVDKVKYQYVVGQVLKVKGPGGSREFPIPQQPAHYFFDDEQILEYGISPDSTALAVTPAYLKQLIRGHEQGLKTVDPSSKLAKKDRRRR